MRAHVCSMYRCVRMCLCRPYVLFICLYIRIYICVHIFVYPSIVARVSDSVHAYIQSNLDIIMEDNDYSHAVACLFI